MLAFLQNIWSKTILWIGTIGWAPKDLLTANDLEQIKEIIIPNYYIILSRRNNYLSTYVIMIGNFLVTGKFGYWDHALMNMEDTVVNDQDFRLIQAIGKGTNYATFDEVFNCNAVVFLKPKSMSAEHWTAVMDKAKSEVGKPYDTLFDLAQDEKLSCVELVRVALMAEPNYATDFANFEAMVQQKKRITPQMFFDCPDFETAYMFRRP